MGLLYSMSCTGAAATSRSLCMCHVGLAAATVFVKRWRLRTGIPPTFSLHGWLAVAYRGSGSQQRRQSRPSASVRGTGADKAPRLMATHLDAVAVVDVPVQHHDARYVWALQRGQRSQRAVVVEAEALRGAMPCRVVEADQIRPAQPWDSARGATTCGGPTPASWAATTWHTLYDSARGPAPTSSSWTTALERWGLGGWR